MILGQRYDHRPEHFRFVRRSQDTPCIEVYEPVDKLRWVALVVAVAFTILGPFI